MLYGSWCQSICDFIVTSICYMKYLHYTKSQCELITLRYLVTLLKISSSGRIDLEFIGFRMVWCYSSWCSLAERTIPGETVDWVWQGHLVGIPASSFNQLQTNNIIFNLQYNVMSLQKEMHAYFHINKWKMSLKSSIAFWIYNHKLNLNF